MDTLPIVEKGVETLQDTWRVWLSERALPLWSGIGFDAGRRLFHERLTFDHKPIHLPALRLMVQARQVSTYCRAQLDGFGATADQALACLHEVQNRYWHADDAAGWIFSLGPDGRPANRQRDLYAHAFILFAYGWAYRVSGDLAYLKVARETALEIDQIFLTDREGYLDTVPPADTIHRQNPHMHLLEAYLVLFDVSGDSVYLDYARRLVTLALEHFILPGTGMLLEFLDNAWKPLQAAGHNRVEPGHLLEWSWLFCEFARLAPNAPNIGAIRLACTRMAETALTYGVIPETLMVCDAITEHGKRLEDSTRIWPQTECIRTLALRARQGDPQADSLIARQSRHFFHKYAPARLSGGWIDRLDVHGVPLSDHMPASSLYHIYGGATAILSL
ncbi:AGE family epimerase/isomerase [Komagataeibacter sp. FNDCR2]|uniref:AGE family epimerase/isomerase n=1 Tax=Komagataeibacter sp. FNDCR2 TaxID=2878682 RepID=UPI001E331F6D|nr:AGE family epimerase/isomerase [Komagataeibacter sp. FNDCR2]MCE2574442.1 AGE family epimerase/isomerase [Komagataeibacter sp. FNDCR2]